MKLTDISNRTPLVIALLALLSIPAFLLNLGTDLLIEDEAIRGLVAFEMGESGDLLTPTLFGELYLKKPPLYNWIILLFFTLFSSHAEWVLRLPMVFSLVGFTFSIYYFLRKEIGRKAAVLLAFMFLTNGRVIIYESLHGLIDIAFSWLIYAFFLLVYFCSKKEKYKELFLFSYTLLAIAYLMKGLPAIAFGGITLLAWFAVSRNFKKLFSVWNFAGIGIFLLLVGGYYLGYMQRNQISLSEIFSVVFHESAQRTPVYYDLKTVLLHFIQFPFDLFYHFFPWTLMVVFLFKRRFREKLKAHLFLYFSALVFLVNVILYWISPQVYARYLIMLVPLMYTVFLLFYLKDAGQNTLPVRIFHFVLAILIVAIAALSLLPLIDEETRSYPFALPKVIALFLLISAVFVLFLKSRSLKLYWFVAALLLLRIGMNWFILPHRYSTNDGLPARLEAREVGEEYAQEPLYAYWNTNFEENWYFGRSFLQYRYMYYLSTARKKQIRTVYTLDRGGLYIAEKQQLPEGASWELVRQLHPHRVSAEIVLIRVPGAEE